MTNTKKNVSVTFPSHVNVTKEELNTTIDQILHRFGCPACGLMGHGFSINGGDPLESEFEKSIGNGAVVSFI